VTGAPPPESRRTSEGARARLVRRLRRPIVLLPVLAMLIGVGAVAWSILRQPPGREQQAAPPPPPSLTAHGTVQPVAQASIATLNGGVVEQLLVRAGQTVEAKQPVARVTAPGQTELLVAPWRGTITGVPVNQGDTVLPGAVVMTIGDLSDYQVETNDVDEYLIGRISLHQPVIMNIAALDQERMRGFVKSVSLQQQQTINGDHYPVVIAFESFNPSLRPGMSVRITFVEEAP
jgi:multidrug efflux pump subunit AcrA (membrane-fusion protein)